MGIRGIKRVISNNKWEVYGLITIIVVGLIAMWIFRSLTTEQDQGVPDPAPVVEAAE